MVVRGSQVAVAPARMLGATGCVNAALALESTPLEVCCGVR